MFKFSHIKSGHAPLHILSPPQDCTHAHDKRRCIGNRHGLRFSTFATHLKHLCQKCLRWTVHPMPTGGIADCDTREKKDTPERHSDFSECLSGRARTVNESQRFFSIPATEIGALYSTFMQFLCRQWPPLHSGRGTPCVLCQFRPSHC
jgi:hypothetical protein